MRKSCVSCSQNIVNNVPLNYYILCIKLFFCIFFLFKINIRFLYASISVQTFVDQVQLISLQHVILFYIYKAVYDVVYITGDNVQVYVKVRKFDTIHQRPKGHTTIRLPIFQRLRCAHRAYTNFHRAFYGGASDN